MTDSQKIQIQSWCDEKYADSVARKAVSLFIPRSVSIAAIPEWKDEVSAFFTAKGCSVTLEKPAGMTDYTAPVVTVDFPKAQPAEPKTEPKTEPKVEAK